jgi:2-iminobutanoate/2-iminopropanoate deaminase
MAHKEIIRTSRAPAPAGPYSQAVAVPGRLLFASGQIPIDPRTGKMVEGDVAAQTRQVMRNLQAVLQEAGASLSHAVKVTVYLRDMGDYAAVNEVYATFFPAGSAPARSTAQVARLPRDAAVEMDAVAVLE